MKHHVKLNKEHLANGVRQDVTCCPIALALGEQFPGVGVEVGPCHAEVGMRIFTLPPEARAFIRYFDSELPVEPIEFDMTEDEEESC